MKAVSRKELRLKKTEASHGLSSGSNDRIRVRIGDVALALL